MTWDGLWDLNGTSDCFQDAWGFGTFSTLKRLPFISLSGSSRWEYVLLKHLLKWLIGLEHFQEDHSNCKASPKHLRIFKNLFRSLGIYFRSTCYATGTPSSDICAGSTVCNMRQGHQHTCQNGLAYYNLAKQD